jgi:hypothetical protein
MCGDTRGRVTLSIPAPPPRSRTTARPPPPGLAALRSSIALRSVDDGAAATGGAESLIEKVDCLIEEAMTGGAQRRRTSRRRSSSRHRSTTSRVADQALDRDDSDLLGNLGTSWRESRASPRCGEVSIALLAKAPICSPISHNRYRAFQRRTGVSSRAVRRREGRAGRAGVARGAARRSRSCYRLILPSTGHRDLVEAQACGARWYRGLSVSDGRLRSVPGFPEHVLGHARGRKREPAPVVGEGAMASSRARNQGGS